MGCCIGKDLNTAGLSPADATDLKLSSQVKIKIALECDEIKTIIGTGVGTVRDVVVVDRQGRSWFVVGTIPSSEVRHMVGALPEALHAVVPSDVSPPSVHAKGVDTIQSLYAISPQLWLGCTMVMEPANVCGTDTDYLDEKMAPILRKIQKHLRE